MARFKDVEWKLPETADGRAATWDAVRVAVLMDIRDELKTLNRLLGCPNFTSVPEILRGIRRNTSKPRRSTTTRRKT